MVRIRVARPADAEALLKIYTPYILTTAFTFETAVPSVEDFSKRIEKYGLKYPWLLAEVNGSIAGYAYASLHREREAYQWTCECSIYMDSAFKGKGIAKVLYDLVFTLLKRQGFRNVYAAITMPNEASENLHRKCGFEKFAEFHNIGYKFDSWHKVGWWRLQINDYDLKPPPPVLFSEMNQILYQDLFDQGARSIEAKLRDSYIG